MTISYTQSEYNNTGWKVVREPTDIVSDYIYEIKKGTANGRLCIKCGPDRIIYLDHTGWDHIEAMMDKGLAVRKYDGKVTLSNHINRSF